MLSANTPARRAAAEVMAATDTIVRVLHRTPDDARRLASLLTPEQREEIELAGHAENAAVRVAAIVYRAQVQTGDPGRDVDAKIHGAVISRCRIYHDDAKPDRQGPRELRDPLAGEHDTETVVREGK